MENKETVFAYIGRDNQLHASEKLDTAIEYCRKKDAEKGIKGSTVVPTDWPFEYGNPVVDGNQVIMYAYNDIRDRGNGNDVKITADMAELIMLYKACDKE